MLTHDAYRRAQAPFLHRSRQRWRLIKAAVLALVVVGVTADAAPPALVPATRSVIDRVLVYSNQARVFRRASVSLRGGVSEVALATLPEAAQRDTVRVTCPGAEVLGAEVRLTRQRLERQQQARQLVERIERIDADLQRLGRERAVLQQEIAFVDRLRLGALPRGPDGRMLLPAGLFVGTWRAILSWSEGRATRDRARLRTIAEQRRKLRDDLAAVKTEARGLDLGQIDEPAWQVVARLRGSGAKKVKVSYLVSNVRWVPSYDLRYDPAKRSVRADYYALVRQQSGEDWSKAQLRFSTALPTLLLAVPELPTWTVGRRRDFTPRPQPRLEPPLQPWQPPPPPEAVDPIVQRLRVALNLEGEVEADGDVAGAERDGRPPPRPKPRSRASDKLDAGTLDFEDDRIEGSLRRPEGAMLGRRARRRFAPYKRKVPIVRPGAPPPAPSPAPPAEMSTVSRTVARSSGWGKPSIAREQLPWTDVGYRPPHLDEDLPAAAAEGYRYVMYAPGRHEVTASGIDHRIPLMRRRLSVEVVHRVVPGRSKLAYTIGALKNSTGKPILRGHANLFAGTMFSGRSWINTALPGKKLRLPLGVDDHVKVERHLSQRTVSQGMVFKDDATEYTVTIEIANNHRSPIRVELEDQVPLKLGSKVEVKHTSVPSGMSKPDKEGRVRWKGTVSGGAVKKLSFKFQIVRPKDWELQQHDY